jgi:hypothetical protein
MITNDSFEGRGTGALLRDHVLTCVSGQGSLFSLSGEKGMIGDMKDLAQPGLHAFAANMALRVVAPVDGLPESRLRIVAMLCSPER